MNKDKGNPFLIITAAVAAVAALSVVPWSDITKGQIKDYNIISDILPNDKVVATASEPIDPALASAIKSDNGKTKQNSVYANDTTAKTINPRVNGQVIIEDYSQTGNGLAHVKQALAHCTDRTVRIAVIGDSYIEGDIFTMHIRQELQNLYGGAGVGYVPLASEVSGFRTSIRESSKGWTIHDMRKKDSKKYKPLSGEYFTTDGTASVKYTGTGKIKHADSWNSVKFLYITPTDGTVTIATDAGEQSYAVSASADVQCIEVSGLTTTTTISTDIAGFTSLGAYVNNTNGIALDNMSLRGNSGISHRTLDEQLATQMRKYINYDLIILEYGINALSSQQTDYTAYGKIMQQVVAQVRKCYPNADILLLGIGDRGQKLGGEVQSLPTSQAMVDAQRNAAKASGCLFWDTREAMGGTNAAIAWREQGLINADYIHLNAKGGATLADTFIKSFKSALK
jgi:lysophospholipase L1-like esterase